VDHDEGRDLQIVDAQLGAVGVEVGTNRDRGVGVEVLQLLADPWRSRCPAPSARSRPSPRTSRSCATPIVQGWQMGRAARPLFGARWNELWERPLEEVRRELGVKALGARPPPASTSAAHAAAA